MRRRATSLYLILSLLLVQISGMHLHLCSGVEKGTDHVAVHYADDGLLFGEDHSQDDSDDREVSLPTAAFATSNLGDLQPPIPIHLAVVFFELPSIETVARLLPHRAAREPQGPVPIALRPFELPPSRGPPVHS